MLTPKQKPIFEYIKKYIKEKGYSPSLEEIGRRFRLAKSTIHQHVETLKKRGYLNKFNYRARSIEILENKKFSGLVEIPLLGTITAGEPIETYQIPEKIEVPKNLLTKGGENFALKVNGNSMIDEGIFDGDTVIIKRQQTAENGESVVALINGSETTLKKIYKEKGGFRLQPANPNLKPIFTKELTIQGKVISVIRNFEELKKEVVFKENKELQKKEGIESQKTEITLNTVELKDCREYLKKIPNDFVNLIAIDPPYNELPKNWDNFQDWEYLKYEFDRILKKNGQIYIFGKQPMLADLYNLFKNKFDFRFELVWNKGKGLWSSNYTPMRSHELIWCFKKSGVKTTDLYFDIESIKTPGKPYVRKNRVRSTVRNNWDLNRTIIKDGRRFPLSVLNHSAVFNKSTEGVKHPTQKPLEMVKWIVKSSSQKGDIVLDCFMGSGTTAVACIQLGRDYIGCEIEKDFYETYKERMGQNHLL